MAPQRPEWDKASRAHRGARQVARSLQRARLRRAFDETMLRLYGFRPGEADPAIVAKVRKASRYAASMKAAAEERRALRARFDAARARYLDRSGQVAGQAQGHLRQAATLESERE